MPSTGAVGELSQKQQWHVTEHRKKYNHEHSVKSEQ